MRGSPIHATQVSVFVENRPGRLTSVLEALESLGVSIRGMSVADAAEIGIIRLIVTEPERAFEELHRRGFTTRTDAVLCVEVDDVPGGLLHGLAEPLSRANLNLHYFYAYTEPSSGKVVAVVKTDDLKSAEKALQ